MPVSGEQQYPDVVGLGGVAESAVEAVVAEAEAMRLLRLERAAILARFDGGPLTGRDRRRYCAVRFALLLREARSCAGRAPRAATAVLARRATLELEAIMGVEASVA